jgi:hypothetical protein
MPTAKALSLDHSRLKRRVGNHAEEEKSGPFVELISQGTMFYACMVEMEDGRDARMRVELKGAAADVTALSRTFWSERRLIAVTAETRIWVARERADFRCGIDGLAKRCRTILNSDPFSGALFVSRNRRSKSIKILSYNSCEAPRKTRQRFCRALRTNNVLHDRPTGGARSRARCRRSPKPLPPNCGILLARRSSAFVHLRARCPGNTPS